jgi:choline kinase
VRALLLAAGVGDRLGEAAQGRPKCLLEFGGRTLLQRHLEALAPYELEEVGIVVGHGAELVAEEVARIDYPGTIRQVPNADYRSGSLVSLFVGLADQGSDHELLLMDADVLYDHRILERLMTSEHRDCFLMDRGFEPGDEPVKLCLAGEEVVEFRKQVDEGLAYDRVGESVGFFRFTSSTRSQLIQRAVSYIGAGENELPYEECIRDVVLGDPGRFGVEDVTGIPWIEIDFPEDVTRAQEEILPLL